MERTQTNSYKDVDICNKAGSAILPPRVAFKTSVRHTNEVNAARKVVIGAQPETVSTAQTTLRNTYDETQGKHYHDILRAFDSCESTNDLHNAWKLVKQLSGKKSKTIFIQGEDRLDAWKTYFKQLLSSDNTRTSNHPVDPIYKTNPNIDTDIFSLAEVNIAIKQMKLGKAPGLDGIPIKVWQLSK